MPRKVYVKEASPLMLRRFRFGTFNFFRVSYSSIDQLKFSHVADRNFHMKNFLFRCHHHHTVFKFHNYSIIQILRETNFGECRSSKTTVFSILGVLNFVNLANFILQKMQKSMKMKIQSL